MIISYILRLVIVIAQKIKYPQLKIMLDRKIF